MITKQLSVAPYPMVENTYVFRTKNLAGRILTIIDSALPEGSQNKSVKALIKKEFREELNNAWHVFHAGENTSFGGSAYGDPVESETRLV